MKSEKGVTLSALVAYIVVFIIILTIMSTITKNFYKNVSLIQDSPKYISEFNKFSMFFIADVKRNDSVTSVADNALEFSDGTKYSYDKGKMYRNGNEIAKYIKDFKFTESDYNVNSITKKIVNVNTTMGFGKEEITRDIDFVLRYW